MKIGLFFRNIFFKGCALNNALENTLAMKTWLVRHKMTESDFMICVKGEAISRPYFPFHLSHQTYPAKILALESSAHQQGGVQAGLLTILKGPLEKQVVVFEANSIFLHTIHFQRGDLSYVLKEGDRVTVEVTEFSGGKERKRMYSKVKTCLEKLSSSPLPCHYALLTYVGSRPKPINCCPDPAPTEFDVEHTPNLKLWLTKRNITCGFFSSLIQGLAPPKRVSSENTSSRKASLITSSSSTSSILLMDELEGPPNVPKEVIEETMAQTNAMIKRVMKCTSPDDPNVRDIITSSDDLQLALFISKSLTSAIMHYTRDTENTAGTSGPIGQPLPPPPLHQMPMAPQNTYAESAYIDTEEPPCQSNFQNRGLCGLREPLLNYDIRHRRRSGDQFRNEWVEPPYKRKFHQQQPGHFR